MSPARYPWWAIANFYREQSHNAAITLTDAQLSDLNDYLRRTAEEHGIDDVDLYKVRSAKNLRVAAAKHLSPDTLPELFDTLGLWRPDFAGFIKPDQVKDHSSVQYLKQCARDHKLRRISQTIFQPTSGSFPNASHTALATQSLIGTPEPPAETLSSPARQDRFAETVSTTPLPLPSSAAATPTTQEFQVAQLRQQRRLRANDELAAGSGEDETRRVQDIQDASHEGVAYTDKQSPVQDDRAWAAKLPWQTQDDPAFGEQQQDLGEQHGHHQHAAIHPEPRHVVDPVTNDQLEKDRASLLQQKRQLQHDCVRLQKDEAELEGDRETLRQQQHQLQQDQAELEEDRTTLQQQQRHLATQRRQAEQEQVNFKTQLDELHSRQDQLTKDQLALERERTKLAIAAERQRDTETYAQQLRAHHVHMQGVIKAYGNWGREVRKCVRDRSWNWQDIKAAVDRLPDVEETEGTLLDGYALQD